MQINSENMETNEQEGFTFWFWPSEKFGTHSTSRAMAPEWATTSRSTGQPYGPKKAKNPRQQPWIINSCAAGLYVGQLTVFWCNISWQICSFLFKCWSCVSGHIPRGLHQHNFILHTCLTSFPCWGCNCSQRYLWCLMFDWDGNYSVLNADTCHTSPTFSLIIPQCDIWFLHFIKCQSFSWLWLWPIAISLLFLQRTTFCPQFALCCVVNDWRSDKAGISHTPLCSEQTCALKLGRKVQHQ